MGLSCMAFIMLMYVPILQTLCVFFKHKWILNFIKCMNWDDYMIFILHCVNVVYHVQSAWIEMIIWFLSFIVLMWYIMLFVDVYHPCVPGINPAWSWCMILLMYCWICLLMFCWELSMEAIRVVRKLLLEAGEVVLCSGKSLATFALVCSKTQKMYLMNL